MNEVKKKMLLNYMNRNVCPILIDDAFNYSFKNLVILESKSDISLLNGHYEGEDFVAPTWYNELMSKSKNGNVVLLIKKINEIEVNEQVKFIEILKYRKISTFDLPSNCVIVATCTDLKENSIHEEVYSLMAHIEV